MTALILSGCYASQLEVIIQEAHDEAVNKGPFFQTMSFLSGSDSYDELDFISFILSLSTSRQRLDELHNRLDGKQFQIVLHSNAVDRAELLATLTTLRNTLGGDMSYWHTIVDDASLEKLRDSLADSFDRVADDLTLDADGFEIKSLNSVDLELQFDYAIDFAAQSQSVTFSLANFVFALEGEISLWEWSSDLRIPDLRLSNSFTRRFYRCDAGVEAPSALSIHIDDGRLGCCDYTYDLTEDLFPDGQPDHRNPPTSLTFSLVDVTADDLSEVPELTGEEALELLRDGMSNADRTELAIALLTYGVLDTVPGVEDLDEVLDAPLDIAGVEGLAFDFNLGDAAADEKGEASSGVSSATCPTRSIVDVGDVVNTDGNYLMTEEFVIEVGFGLSSEPSQVEVVAWAGDSDGDGWFDGDDNCPWTANESQVDGDYDGEGDECDVSWDASVPADEMESFVATKEEELERELHESCIDLSCIRDIEPEMLRDYYLDLGLQFGHPGDDPDTYNDDIVRLLGNLPSPFPDWDKWWLPEDGPWPPGGEEVVYDLKRAMEIAEENLRYLQSAGLDVAGMVKIYTLEVNGVERLAWALPPSVTIDPRAEILIRSAVPPVPVNRRRAMHDRR